MNAEAMTGTTDPAQELEVRVANGDNQALAQLFGLHQSRLQRMVTARMDPQLHSRLGDSDVLQEVYLDAQRRMGEYDPCRFSFFIWLRLLTGQRLVDMHRFHLGAKRRSARRETRPGQTMPDASSLSLASYFISQLTSASEAAIRAEIKTSVRSAIDELDETDRELLSLRHFEQLTNQEAAEILGMNPNTASSRHLRAVKRLRSILARNPAFVDHTADF